MPTHDPRRGGAPGLSVDGKPGPSVGGKKAGEGVLPQIRQLPRWPWVALFGLLALALGFQGFRGYFAATGGAPSIWDTLYLTVQLFVLESGSVSGPVPWQLDVARFLAPAVAGYTALRALAVVFREQFERFQVRFLRGHVVICALGRKGLLLARSLRKGGERVVVIEEDAENDLIETARGYGILVLIGDARDPQVLRNASIRRASHLVAVSGDDGVNAEVAVRARDLVSGRGAAPLSCLIHIVDPQLCDLLRMQEIGGSNEESIRLDFFNVFESGARTLLEEYPVTGKAGQGEPGRDHIVVVGLGQFGESLVLQGARQWHARRQGSRQRLRVTVVDQDARVLTDSLLARYPWLAQACQIRPVEIAFESRAFAEASFLFDAHGAVDVSSIYVCVDDDSHGISTALTLHRKVKGREVPVVVRMVHGAGLASLLTEERVEDGEFAGLRAFGLLDLMGNPDLLFAGAYESLARAIHEEYVRLWEKRGRNRDEDPVLAPWEELPESLKESQRVRATQIGPKLSAVRCGLGPLTDWDAEGFAFREEEVDRLARMEPSHQPRGGKVRERKLRSRARGQGRVEEGPGMERLAQDMEQEFVRALPRILAKAGFQIVREEGGSGGRTSSGVGNPGAPD